MKSFSTPEKKINQSAFIILLSLWHHLSRRRRTQLVISLSIMLASGIAELASLGSVFPFLLVLSEPEKLLNLPIGRAFADTFRLSEANQLLFLTTLIFGFSVILASIIRISSLWINGRLAADIGSDLSCESYMRTLFQPYEFHLKTSSSTVISNITSQITKTVLSINAFLQLITSAVIATALLIGLLIIDAPIAIVSVALFGLAYSLLAATAKRELSTNGKKIVIASSQVIKALQEGLGAIREVLLDGNQQFYLNIFSQADRPQRQLNARNVFIGTYPRYALESLGMVSISIIGYFAVLQKGNEISVIPLLGSLALGAQRLLPALQQIYNSWATLNAQKPAVLNVLSMLSLSKPSLKNSNEEICFDNAISLDKICFKYVHSQPRIIDDVSFEIKKGETIGIIGSTGSGKSTFLDLLMGLLPPSSGQILVDGKDLYDPKCPNRLEAWRSKVAHVPQSIFLTDASIAENIALGLPKNKINLSKLKLSAECAQIADFVESIPKKYETFVGERGMQLSGGQRQRIGIARALYKEASILVFDEATSALDNSTELAVMNAINSLKHGCTKLIIAHRLSTLSDCDRIIMLENGILKKILNSGEPEFNKLFD